MAKINTYIDKNGYKIRATEKVYNMYYKKQGFKLYEPKAQQSSKVQDGDPAASDPEEQTDGQMSEEKAAVSDPEEQDGDAAYKSWTIQSLKEALNEAGIPYSPKATKKELYDLLQGGKE